MFWLVKTMSTGEEELSIFYLSNNLGDAPSLFQRYIVASYFVTTVFTTVGFGDIAAVLREEAGPMTGGDMLLMRCCL